MSTDRLTLKEFAEVLQDKMGGLIGKDPTDQKLAPPRLSLFSDLLDIEANFWAGDPLIWCAHTIQITHDTKGYAAILSLPAIMAPFSAVGEMLPRYLGREDQLPNSERSMIIVAEHVEHAKAETYRAVITDGKIASFVPFTTEAHAKVTEKPFEWKLLCRCE